jgi:hypothetical protein
MKRPPGVGSQDIETETLIENRPDNYYGHQKEDENQISLAGVKDHRGSSSHIDDSSFHTLRPATFMKPLHQRCVIDVQPVGTDCD